MCGIAGAVSSRRTGRDLASAVRAMTARLRHRGPDREASRSFDRCVLGHTRLRIIDLSDAADEPLPNEDETCWLSFNGEIYNWRELRDALKGRGHHFLSHSDSEVIVHLYEEEGRDLLDALQGIFAFAIWDEAKQSLFLARDRLGIKPLYYAEVPGGLLFASEIRALVASGLVSGELDEAALAQILTVGSVQSPRTAVRGVHELPAGHFAEWRPESALTISAYWKPEVTPDPSITSREQAVELLEERLSTAVRRQLLADVPVGIFLSSGVDSGVVAAIAASQGGILRTLTVRVGGAADETAAAAVLARKLGSEHHEVAISDAEAAAAVASAIADLDQPSIDGFNTWMISRAAREIGLVVALSGLGGDELFFGYPSFRAVPRMLGIARAAGPASGALGRVLQVAARGRIDSKMRRLAGFLGDGRTVEAAYASVRQVFPPGMVGGVSPVHEVSQPAADVRDEVMLLELTRYMGNQLLRDADQMSMAHALEVRVPLLDEGIVDLALRIPASLKVEKGRSKGLLIDAARDRVPPGFGRQPKLTFTLPFDTWLRGPLRDVAREALFSADSVLGDMIDTEIRARLWRDFEDHRLHWSRIWAPVALDMWVRSEPFAPR